MSYITSPNHKTGSAINTIKTLSGNINQAANKLYPTSEIPNSVQRTVANTAI